MMKSAEEVRVKSLICKSVKGDRNAYERLKSENLTTKTAEWQRKTFVALVELVGRKGGFVTYEELAQKANALYPTYLPTRGGALAQNLGRILGELSLISWCVEEFLISVVVINKALRKQGEGFEKLALLLEADLSEKDRWLEKTKEICRILVRRE